MSPADEAAAGRLLIAFYGDDFTGSTGVMEVLPSPGCRRVLFLDTPDARSGSPGFAALPRASASPATARAARRHGWTRICPGVFAALGALGAPVAAVQGLLDVRLRRRRSARSAARIEIALADPRRRLGAAARRPRRRCDRYQAFGNLFAAVDGIGYRLDRHPTMARHPVTPMEEADLGRHLARQTRRPIGLVDLVAMKPGRGERRWTRRSPGAEIVSLDVIDDETLREAGRLVWQRGGRPVFGLGSQGFEAALVAFWREWVLPVPEGAQRPGPAAQIACVSGSVSPTTADQIGFALAHGFEGIRLDVRRLGDASAFRAEIERATADALDVLGRGRDALIFSATGPDDPAVAALLEAARTAGLPLEQANERLGAGLGQVLKSVIEQAGLRRAVVSGGDTSGRAAAALGIDALTAIAPLKSRLALVPRARERFPRRTADRPEGWAGRPGGLFRRRQAGRTHSIARLGSASNRQPGP